MTAQLRKISVLSLLLIAMTPLVYLTILPIKQQWIRNKMEEELQEKAGHTVFIQENELHWIRPGKELLIEGKMFDVEKMVRLNNGLIKLTGLTDDEETTLLRHLEKNQEEDNMAGKKAFSFFFSFQLAMPEQNNTDTDYQSGTRIQHTRFNDHIIPCTDADIITPPPRA